MFDIGWDEMFLIAIMAVIIIGPKDLPGAIRTISQAIAKVREFSSEIISSMNDIANEVELEKVREEFHQTAIEMEREIKDATSVEALPDKPKQKKKTSTAKKTTTTRKKKVTKNG